MFVSVCLPVYNEKKALRKSVQELIKTMKKLPYKFEVIVVDDGSTDDCTKTIKDLKVKIVRHKQQMGAGIARVTAMKVAKGDVIFQSDADNTYPTKKIGTILKKLETHELVVGARKYETAKDFKILRIATKWIIKSVASYLAQTHIPDLNSGMRAYYKDTAMSYAYLYPPGHSIMSTMTLAYLLDKRKVAFVPIDYRVREGKSSFHPLKDTYNYILATTRAIAHFNPFRITTQFVFWLSLIMVGFLFNDLLTLNLNDTTVTLGLTILIIFLFGIMLDQIVSLRKYVDKRIEESLSKKTISLDYFIEE